MALESVMAPREGRDQLEQQPPAARRLLDAGSLKACFHRRDAGIDLFLRQRAKQ
jgi:hypothetical protein